MKPLRQATAKSVKVGPFLDSTDGVTTETALSILQANVLLSKDGGTLTQKSETTTATHDAGGWYLVPLNITDTSTLGLLQMSIQMAGALPVWEEFVVFPAKVYDSLFAGTDNLEVDVIQIIGEAAAAGNFRDTYNGTGYTNSVAPAQQQQLDNLAIGTGSLSQVADGAVVSVGVQSGTYLDTQQADGNLHSLTDVAGEIDLYYEFELPGTGVPTEITLQSYVVGSNDVIDVFGYNWGTSSWEQIGTIIGSSSTTPVERTFTLLTTHVGAGTDLGKVRVRFQNAALSSAIFAVDFLYVSYTNVNLSIGYAMGAVWIDTNNGTSGTVRDVNGTADNPVDNLADAVSLATAIGLRRFQIAIDSTIILDRAFSGYTFLGEAWILDLNGQDIGDCVFDQAKQVTGIALSSDTPIFRLCGLGDITIPRMTALRCGIGGTITLTGTGDTGLFSCSSQIAGTGTPVIDFGAAVGSQNVNVRRYSGGIEVQNMGQSGTDNMSLEGHGQIAINANCVGGTIAIRGHFKKTDNSGGAVTISETVNYKDAVVNADYAQGDGTGNNQIQLATTASTVDGAYDPALIFIVSGTGAGQCRLIIQYVGSTRVATVDRDWKVNPDATSSYRVLADIGREHVNEGQAQAGAASTITLNALASSVDETYTGQIVFLRSGTGADQARKITAYNGTTKVATINTPWVTNPDSTTGYVLLPTSYSLSAGSAADVNLISVGGTSVAGPDDLKADTSNLDVAVSTRSSHSAADVWSVTTRTLTSISAFLTDIATAVWAFATRTVTGGTTTADNMRGTDGAITDLTGVATEANQTVINDNIVTVDGKVDIIDGIVDELKVDITFIRGMTGGNWAIVSNQMIFYNEAGTEIARFDLTKDGVPDSDAPDARTLV